MRKNSSKKLLEWSERIKQQKLSNKTIDCWCEEQSISPHTFQYWQKKIKTLDVQSKGTFLEIPEDRPFIEVSLRGAKLTLSKDFDRDALMYFLSLFKVSVK